MSYIYIYEQGTKLTFKQNQIVVINPKKELVLYYPIEGVEAVILIGDTTLTSDCVKNLLRREINLTWLGINGKFYGRLESTQNVNVLRHKMQFEVIDDAEFSLSITKKILTAKINNQFIIAKRYLRNRQEVIANDQLTRMNIYKNKIDLTNSIEEARGYEGGAAKEYFKILSMVTEEGFRFEGRNRQPPTDKFNSLLSFGYTLLFYEVYTAIVNKGLNPYVSIIHSLRNGHPALCSDLMEEFRAVIIDSLVMYCISKSIIKETDFEKPNDEGGIYLKKEAAKTFIAEYEKKIRTKTKYLSYTDFDVSFRRAIELQIGQLIKAMENRNAENYMPVTVR